MLHVICASGAYFLAAGFALQYYQFDPTFTVWYGVEDLSLVLVLLPLHFTNTACVHLAGSNFINIISFFFPLLGLFQLLPFLLSVFRSRPKFLLFLSAANLITGEGSRNLLSKARE